MQRPSCVHHRFVGLADRFGGGLVSAAQVAGSAEDAVRRKNERLRDLAERRLLTGLRGAPHLAPSWIFEGHDSILAVDIGGTNIRCGVVETRSKKSPDLSKASVWKSELWRHADDEPNPRGGGEER